MLVSDIVNIIIQSIAFANGLFINIKIIYVCLNDKSSKTRNIDIIYSIFSTIFYLFDIPFLAITNDVPNLSMYTEEWLCHIASCIIIFCIHIIFMYSFWVALLKYVFIAHWDRALPWGHEKIERTLLIIVLVLSLIFTIIIILTKDFDSYEALNSCYGIETKNCNYEQSTLQYENDNIVGAFDQYWVFLGTESKINTFEFVFFTIPVYSRK